MCSWFKSLSPRNQALTGIGIMAYGLGGLYVHEKFSEYMNIVPDEHDWREYEELKQNLKKKITDRLPTITVVDRKDR